MKTLLRAALAAAFFMPGIALGSWNIQCADGVFVVEDGEVVEWLVAEGYVVRPTHYILPWTSPYGRAQLAAKAAQYRPPPLPPPPPSPEPPAAWWTVEVCDEAYHLNLTSPEAIYREFYRVEALYADRLFDHLGTARARGGAGPGYEWLEWGSARALACASELRVALRIEVGRRGWRPDLAPLEALAWGTPPAGYLVLSNEFLRLGFVESAGGVLAWLSYLGSPNLLDDSAVSSRASSGKPDRGREYQGVLWEGYPPRGATADRQLCYDIVNPTQAAGNWGNSHVPLIEWTTGPDYVEGLVKPYDYYSLRAGCRGPYRMARIGDIFPETTWWLRFRYTLDGRTVRLVSEFWHEDAEPRWLDHSNIVALLNPAHFQRPLGNEHLRDWSSWRQDRIDDDKVVALAPGLGIRLTFRGNAGVGTTHHGHVVDWRDPLTQAEPGEANVVELGVQGDRYRWVKAGEIIRQDSTLRVEEM